MFKPRIKWNKKCWEAAVIDFQDLHFPIRAGDRSWPWCAVTLQCMGCAGVGAAPHQSTFLLGEQHLQETKGHPDLHGAQVRSPWGLAGKSEMRSTHQAAQSTGTDQLLQRMLLLLQEKDGKKW